MKSLYHGMNKLSRWVALASSSLGGIMIALCFFALFFQVVYRFILVKIWSFAFPFTEEFARYALVWSCYLCIAACLREGSQASVNFLYDRVTGKAKVILFVATRLLMWIFLWVAIGYGYLLVQRHLNFRSATLQLPGIFIFSAPLVGSLLMAYETVTEVVGVLSGELEPFAGRPFEETQEEVSRETVDGTADSGDFTAEPER